MLGGKEKTKMIDTLESLDRSYIQFCESITHVHNTDARQDETGYNNVLEGSCHGLSGPFCVSPRNEAVPV